MSLLKSLLKVGITPQGQNIPEPPSTPVEPQNIDISFNLNKGSLVKHLPSDNTFTVTKRTLDKATKVKWLWDDKTAYLYDECISVAIWQDSDYQDLANSLALIADRTFMTDTEAKTRLEAFRQSYDRLNLIAAYKLLSTNQQAIIKALMDLIKAEQAEKTKLESSVIRSGDRVILLGEQFNEFVRLLRVAVPPEHKYRASEQAKIDKYWFGDWDWMAIHPVTRVDGDVLVLGGGRRIPVNSNCVQKWRGS